MVYALLGTTGIVSLVRHNKTVVIKKVKAKTARWLEHLLRSDDLNR